MFDNFELVMANDSFILYYGDVKEGGICTGYELEIDDGKFNGNISSCFHAGEDEEIWSYLTTSPEAYEYFKKVGLKVLEEMY